MSKDKETYIKVALIGNNIKNNVNKTVCSQIITAIEFRKLIKVLYPKTNK